MNPVVQIIISEDVQSQQNAGNPVNMVENPLLDLGAPLIPTALSFSITIIIAGADFNKRHIIELTLVDNSEKLLFSSGESNMPVFGNEATNMTINMNLKNVVFNYEGEYCVNFFLNKTKYSHKFSIQKQNQQVYQ